MPIDINELRLDSTPLPGACSGVYFLFSKDDLLYIGEGGNCALRVAEHTRNPYKPFASYAVIPVDDEQERKTLERRLRGQFRPPYNRN